MSNSSNRQKPTPGNSSNGGNNAGSRKNRKSFKTRYRHYRTGKIMEASDYGYKAWYF